jgi:hypothetical protein
LAKRFAFYVERVDLLIEVLRASASMKPVIRGEICEFLKIGSNFKRLSL